MEQRGLAGPVPVVNVVLKAVEARRYQDPQPQQQIRIDHNSNITLAQAEGDDRLRVEFGFTTSYGALGVVKMEGAVAYQAPGAKGAAEEWQKTRNLPQDVAQQVHGAIMTTCLPEAVGLAKGIRLPPPIPIPQVRIQKGQETASAPVDGPDAA